MADPPAEQHDGSPADGSASPRWWDAQEAWATEQLDSRRGEQVRAIVEAFARQDPPVEVGIYPSDDRPQDMEYLYVKGVVLTRDVDVDRVNRAMGRDGVGWDKRDGMQRAPGAPPPVSGLTVLPLPPADELGAALDTLAWFERLDERLGVGVAVPNHVVHICPGGGCPATEPLPAAGAPRPPVDHDERTTGRGVKVVVLDTGLLETVRDEHEWLEGVWGETEPPGVGRYRGHGTFVAGVVRTMAPSAEVEVRRLFIVEGAVLEDHLAAALVGALAETPDVISMSAGTTTRFGLPLLAMENFWTEHLSKVKGTVLVAAAGNDGNRGPFWPAAFPWAVSVGALDTDGTRAAYSNHGSWVDVYAEGTDVVNAYPRGWYTYRETPFAPQKANFLTGMACWSGTSFSTPVVSGLVAARMTWSGESARLAADALLVRARANARPEVGAVLEPGMGAP
jgi:subtilisin family serine protease